MIRSVRPAVLITLLVAVACTEQPTEPTRTEAPFQAVLGPPPEDVKPLFGTVPAAGGGPIRVDLGVWESPAVAKITVTGLLSWTGPETGVGFYPGSSGQLDDQGMWVPAQGNCASQLSVRIDGVGAIGGAFGYCPATWLTAGTGTQYAVASGSIYAVRTSPAPGACYYGGAGCAAIIGEQLVTVEPVEADLTIKLDTTVARVGQVIGAQFGVNPVVEGGKVIPWSLREIRFEGQGPVLGGGIPKGCENWFSSTKCGIRIFQSGYVVAEGMANGKLKTQRQWIRVIGGDSLPTPPPPPPDTMPKDSVPSDTTHGGGSGGGGGGGCSSGVSGLARAAPIDSSCSTNNDSLLIVTSMELSRRSLSPVLSPCFDAKTQVAKTWYCANDDTRIDTVTVHLKASYSGRAPAEGVAVLLSSTFSRVGTEHSHPDGWGPDSLVSGRFVLLGNPVSGNVGVARSIRIVLGPSADTTIIFRTAGVAGKERLSLTVDTTSLKVGTGVLVLGSLDSVRVRLEGLEELTEDQSDSLIGYTDQHPSNHWGTPEMNGLLRQIADSVAAYDARMLALPPSRRPFGTFPRKLAINDMSLPDGGVFDIDTAHAASAWSTPHQTHRDGQHADVRIRRDSTYDNLSDYVLDVWEGQMGRDFVNERQDRDHVHLANQPTRLSNNVRGLGAAALFCLGSACAGGAQTPASPASELPRVALSVDSVWRDGVRLAVAYRLSRTGPGGPEIRALLLRPGTPLSMLTHEAPDGWLDRKVTYEGIDAMEWRVLGTSRLTEAGAAEGGFVIRGRALFGSTPYILRPVRPPRLTSEDQLGDPPPYVSVWADGVTGMILGPSAPIAETTAGRADVLVSTVATACSAYQDIPRGICQNLSRKARDVSEAAGAGDTKELARTIRVFLDELNAQRLVHVPNDVYWRLVADVLMVAP